MVLNDISKMQSQLDNQVCINDNQCKLFLGGISPSSNEDSLKAFYRQYGEIVDLTIMRDQSTGRSRGFGFVTFKGPENVDSAQAARPHIVDGKLIDSKRVLPPIDSAGKNVGNNSGRKIFVGGLKAVHDEQSIREHFKQFGNILGIRILVDKNTGRKRGFGYIEYEDYDSADKAALFKNHTINYISVDVKKSTYKPETNRKFEKQQENKQQVNSGTGQLFQPCNPYPTGPYPPPYGCPPPPEYNGWGVPPPSYPQPQSGYGATAPPGMNGWYYKAPAEDPQSSKGNYPQSYNGGPQKGGKLQGYRNKPYQA